MDKIVEHDGLKSQRYILYDKYINQFLKLKKSFNFCKLNLLFVRYFKITLISNECIASTRTYPLLLFLHHNITVTKHN